MTDTRFCTYFFKYTALCAVIFCSCIDKTDLPFEPGTSSMAVPEELLGNWLVGEKGNWLLSEGVKELFISEDSLIWQDKHYAIFDVHQLVKTYRVLAADGGDTLALYPEKVKSNTLSAALVNGTGLAVDENGELRPGDKTEFIRWWYPLGTKFPAAGTKWIYSYYRYRETGHGDDYHGSSKYQGRVFLEVLDSDTGDVNFSIKLRKTVFIDTMENHYWGRTWDPDPVNDTIIRQDTLATNYIYSTDDYNLFYSDDSLYIAQDTTDLIVSPVRVINNSRIYMQLFSTNNESYLTGRDIKLERKKGITDIGYEDSYYGITVSVFKFHMKLLEFSPGSPTGR